MQSSETSHKREDLESQVWSAIAAFEQIVETIPNDRVSLEALSHAYEQVGDLSRARDYLTRLASVVIDEKDRDAAEFLRERLLRFAATDPVAREAGAKIEAFLSAGLPQAKTFELATDAQSIETKNRIATESRNAHVASELSFAWTLFQAGELSQEDYALVAQDLSAVSTSSAPVTVSVLHALHDRGHRSLERIMSFASRDSGVPVIPLSLFEITEAARSLLPLDFMIRYGVMPFELMGSDVLVAVLNPYNRQLRENVQTAIGRRCHIFMAGPGEFDVMMELFSRKDHAPVEGKVIP
ncbi:MAG: hypothetical protein WCO42_03135 [bacterium]